MKLPGLGPPSDAAPHGEPATGYTYALPGGWVHLDLTPSRRAASVRRAVSGRVRREPRLAPHLAQLDRLLLQECEVAAAGGAERVSLLAEAAPSGLVTAAVTFASTPVAAGTTGGAVTVAALAELLAGEHARALGRDPGATLSFVDLASLGPRAAVRREWGQPSVAAAESPRPPGSRSWQLVLPWPGRARVGLLTLSSSAEALWPRLGPLFDACGQTFRWTFDDRPGDGGRAEPTAT